MSKSVFASLLAVAVVASGLSAQITLTNSAITPPSVFAATVGGGISIDSVNVQVGLGSAARAATVANTSWLPTGHPLASPAGFTIQYWYRPAAAVTFGYHLGDPSMVSPLGGFSGGAFRVFQSGTGGPTGGLTLRGVPNQVATADVGSLNTTPLTTSVNASGWVHLCWRWNPAANTIALLVNGAATQTVAQVAGAFNWTGSNLELLGFSNTTSLAGAGNYDDLRVYQFARTDGDIAADFMSAATGLGPSGAPNTPDVVYFNVEGSVQAHTAFSGVTQDAVDNRPNLVSNNTIVQWGADSPTLPLTPSSCLINLTGGVATQDHFGAPMFNPACNTPGVLNLTNCHGFSLPAAGPSITFPDGLMLGLIPGLTQSLGGAYAYSGGPPLNLLLLPLPAGLLLGGGVNADNTPLTGQEIRMQWISPDPGYPSGIAVTAPNGFRWMSPSGTGPNGEGFHFEARGAGSIQVAGFFELWNTGTVDIMRLEVDCGGNLAAAAVPGAGPAILNLGFNTIGALNTGGTLSTGNSSRFGSELACDVSNVGQVPTITNLGAAPPLGDAQMITFNYAPGGAFAAGAPGATGTENGFSATVDRHAFDSDTTNGAINNVNGNVFIGATVSVTFTNGTRLTGVLVGSGADPFAAILNL